MKEIKFHSLSEKSKLKIKNWVIEQHKGNITTLEAIDEPIPLGVSNDEFALQLMTLSVAYIQEVSSKIAKGKTGGRAKKENAQELSDKLLALLRKNPSLSRDAACQIIGDKHGISKRTMLRYLKNLSI
jgi:hypothetical protein